ncbi:MAG: hypothetical protein CVV44_16335 [Spirochaetae bacterium HGW-Spirochaetae-1]|jgi:hypothetical protein|nr:MAG: hypothetical protein CVV44_16335 [Spirochaetae bacterium HGW-Spirochaetae-1]
MVFSIMRIRHFKNNVKIKTVETVLFLTFVKNRIYMASHEYRHGNRICFHREKYWLQNRIYKNGFGRTELLKIQEEGDTGTPKPYRAKRQSTYIAGSPGPGISAMHDGVPLSCPSRNFQSDVRTGHSPFQV